MEEAWYLFPGQSLENTKIKDRGKALIVTPKAWNKITGHLEKKKIQQEILDKELAHRQYLKDGSKEMTKNWDNSIEKIQQRRLEKHDIKAKAREEELYKRYMELRKEQADERTKIVEEVNKRIYMHQEQSRNLNSALLLSEVLYERKLQQEFDKLEEEHEQIEEAKYAQLVQRNAEQEKIENAEKQRKRKEKDIQHSKELKKQIEQIKEDEQKNHEEKIADEIIDITRAEEELKAIQEYEFKLDRAKKANVKKQFHEFAVRQKHLKEEAKKQEEIEDKIIKIYDKAKCRIEQFKKDKEKEFHQEQIKIREKLAAKTMAEQANIEEAEQQLLAKAKKEYDEKEIQVLEKKEAYQKRLKEEQEANRKMVMQRKLKEEETKKEIEKWEMATRLKTNEVVKVFEQNKAQRLFDDKIRYRKELDKQIKDEDNTEYEKKCIEEELQFYKQKLENDDKAFFAYADEVLELAKSKGRTTEPILKVIQKYKTDNNLEPRKKNLSMQKSKVPINNKNK